MSDILCRWLNEELQLSKTVEPTTFARTFSSGYLIGEVLHKYQLQNDFNMFMKKDTSISKLNNFTRLEPTLQLLGISFDINTAQDLMQEKQGVATHLLYQLYVSLEKKRNAEISGTMMEIMQPAANAGLHQKEHKIYSDKLHQVVKRDSELKLHKISQHYEQKRQQANNTTVVTHPIQPKRQFKVQEDKRIKKTEKLRVSHQKPNGSLTFNQATIVKMPKPPPYTSQLNIKRRQQQRREQQAQTVQTEIAQFETNRKKLVTCGFASSSSVQPFHGDLPPVGTSNSCNGPKLILQSNSKYIQEIRQRLEENAVAREQREKRRDRFLVEQLKAHEAQEEAKREEQLVKRLTRQTQQEQRLATQLLQIRRQKDVIQENRLFREQQYQQRRERDFQEALEREAALVQRAKLERAEEIRKELDFCKRIAAERAQSRYKKHFTSCKEIVMQIVDLATKVGEYRLLTENLIPGKKMTEWKELLLSGLPLYEPTQGQQPGFEFSPPLDPVELEKQELLNSQDYEAYTNMAGEWAWSEETGETTLPLTNNNILGHVVQRLKNIVHPPIILEHSPSSFTPFTLKACVMGKFCSGKTTCVAKIAEAHGIYLISADTLIEEAVIAYKKEITEKQRQTESDPLFSSSTLLKPDIDDQEQSRSVIAKQGSDAEKELRKGGAVPNELLVDMIIGAIRQVPAQSGWILDGFPVDIAQAHLLEKALGGSVEERKSVKSSRTNFAVDPNPPKPPAPVPPVLDLALLLDIPDESVVRRAISYADTDSAPKPVDKNLYLAQIPHRITAFQDTWPKLEEWYGGKQNILVRVDADVEEEELCKRVESVLQQVMISTHTDNTPSSSMVTPPNLVEDVLDNEKAPDSSQSKPLTVDQPDVLTDEAPGPTKSLSSLNEDQGHSEVKSSSKSNTSSPRGHSGKVSTVSVTNEDTHSNPPGSPIPGSSSWIYVDEPLPPEISDYLWTQWDMMCDSYVNNVKTVMQHLRSQCTVIDHHLFNIREEFKHYLGRPDLKQEFVSQWQKDFNNIPDDMREDEDRRAELYLRLDELCERLWDITDKRKEDDEQERAAMSEGWVDDQSALLINYHSALMQVELDRFQNTLCILRVYYQSMCRHVLPELPTNFACIPLLDKDEEERSTEPTGTSVGSQMSEGEDKRKPKFVPFLPRRPDSSGGVITTEDQAKTEPIKPPNDKLNADYEEALLAISKLVAEEAHQGETKVEKEKPQVKRKPQGSAKHDEKLKVSSKKHKGPPSPSPPPAPSPALVDDTKTPEQELRNKIHKEYAAALEHEKNSAKVRTTLVKAHGLAMLNSLQGRVEQTLGSMEQWLQEHYTAEMKSIEQLSEWVRQHIKAGAKLQNELVLECTDFYLNGDCYMVASPAPPPRPPPQCTLTISQLQSLHMQLFTVAPSGLISSSEFFSLLQDIVSVNMGRLTLPEPWIGKNETQLKEIVALLMNDYELVDCRQFLLSAALPWPFPSLSQLLVMLERFRAADSEDTGYINEDQYLKTEFWFPHESVQPVPEDPSEHLAYDRLANLHKFFFQLFADHSVSPPRLDYVSTLQYFAADPNPRQGFIRALSVMLGQHLRVPLMSHLVKSMPSIEEAPERSSSELDGEYKEGEALCASSGSLGEQEVTISDLLAVICHKVTKLKDDIPLPPGRPSQQEHTENLVNVFTQLGYRAEDSVPFSVLSQHTYIQNLMETSTQYQLINIHRMLLAHQDEAETNSLTVS